MGNAKAAPMRGRIKAIGDWLGGKADTPLGRLSLQWFKAYFAASRNSGCALTIYSALSVMPVVLVAIAVIHPTTGSSNVFADHLVDHLNLTGSTAGLVRDTFGSASSNALAASITAVVSFLLWGVAVGQIYQDVYARAWGLRVGSLADQGLFAIFFFVLCGAAALNILAAERTHTVGWLLLVPVWLAAATVFWLWTPRFLLHRKIGLRALLPGALLSAFLLGGTAATAPLYMPGTLNANGKAFGSFGVVLAVIGYVFVLMTMSLACGVFSPVWAEWRRSEKELRDRRAAGGAPAAS